MNLLANLRLSRKILVCLSLPMALVLVLAFEVVAWKYRIASEMATLRDIAPLIGNVSRLVHEMQKERGASAVYLGSKGERFGAEMKAQRNHSDQARKAVADMAATVDVTALGGDFAGRFQAALGKVDALFAVRPGIDSLSVDTKTAVGNFTRTIRGLLDVVGQIGKVSADREMATQVSAYLMLMEGKERAGQERAVAAGAFAAGAFDTETYRRFVALITQQETFFDQLRTLARPDQSAFFDKTLDNDVSRTVQSMRKAGLDSIGAGNVGGVTGAAWFKAATDRINLLKDVEDRMASDVDQLGRDLNDAARRTLMLAASSSLAGLVGAVLLAAAIAREMTRSLGRLTGSMQALAGNDLTVTIDGTERSDEVGVMARAVAVFKDALAVNAAMVRREAEDRQLQAQRSKRIEELAVEFDRSASATVNEVARQAGMLQGTAGSMSEAAAQTSEQASQVASAAEVAATNVQTVAAAAEELSASIGEIGRQVCRASEISGIAVDRANDAERIVGELNDAAQRIGEVVGMINTVASQTNLLALNATIEAARAGEAGKGFAVVAGEVKGLANQTARATDEIGSQIASVQAKTRDAVAAIAQIVAVIREVGEISSGIASAVEEQGAATQAIAENVEQAAAGTSEVSESVGRVQVAANQTGAAAEDVLLSAQSLDDQARSLDKVVRGFLDGIRSV